MASAIGSSLRWAALSLLLTVVAALATSPAFCETAVPEPLAEAVAVDNDVKALLDQGRLAMFGSEPSDAVHLFFRAAEAGSARALGAIGELHELGLGLKPSVKEAMIWYRRGAAAGDAESRARLGLLLINSQEVGSLKEGVELIQKAAKQGNPFGLFALGQLQLQGLGVPRDDDAAIQSLLAAAEQQVPAANRLLGKLYLEGRLVHRDPATAATLLVEAARVGDVAAQTQLGELYRDGEGVEPDVLEAVYWFERAAERGDAQAMGSLGDILLHGDEQIQNQDRAIELLRRAAELGQASAQFQLGQCLIDGEGIDKDPEQGLRWMRIAAASGFQQATLFMEETHQ
jgi:TPR repeat protein